MGQYEKALPYFEQTLEMIRKAFPAPKGHERVAFALNNLGYLHLAMGTFEQAKPYLEQALAMQERLFPKSEYPNGNRSLVIGLDNLGGLQMEMGAYEPALAYFERSLEMVHELYPDSEHPDPQVARVHSNMGNILRVMGTCEKALPHFEKALAILQRLFPDSKHPDGFPDLAVGLNNLGLLLGEMGQYEKAVPYLEQGLAMNRKLYPESKYPAGHVELALALNNQGVLLQRLKRYEEARACLEQALAMRGKLYPQANYPNGHPLLLKSVVNLGLLLYDLGLFDQAQPLFDQALAMSQKIYQEENFPQGHPEIARCHFMVAYPLSARGSSALALEHLTKAAIMEHRLAEQQLGHASEAGAFALQAGLANTHNAYLAVAAHVPGSDAAAYQVTWDAKAIVTRVLEKRHANARAAGTAQAAELARLRDLRRQTERLLQQPRLAPKERDQQLTALADEREKLERSLAAALPVLARWKERDRLGPEDLINALPRGAVFVDFVFYHGAENDFSKPGLDAVKTVPRYAAFILAPGQTPKRIELGNETPFSEAITEWRKAIETRIDRAAAGKVARLVWEPIAKHLPPKTQTVYLSVAGDLARIPWAALPGSTPGTVLLEEFTGGIALVPHGPFLLEHLKFPVEFTGPTSVLALGDVAYGNTAWPPLPGTKVEMRAFAPLAPSPPETLTGAKATPERLLTALPKVRYAHLATHGLFQADELAAEHLRAAQRLDQWAFQQGQSTTRLTAAKNPLGFVGVVLSGGEIVTGMSLVDLPLENLKLVTLSACETGLGEFTGGEGVQGLQRAFHLAGCPNVVASLWNVNDAATAALMAKFYFELWTNKKLPMAALREAQLTIYRHPELIPDLAGERGAPKLKEAVAVKSVEPGPAATGVKRADTKLWAAFVLSGAGK